jgi:ankyrin repeat protein
VGGRAGTPAVGTLTQAARGGDVAELRRLAATGVNIEERDADGMTALHWAAFNGRMEAVKVLVQARTRSRRMLLEVQACTPLHEAAAEHADRKAAALIEEQEREEAAKAQIKVRGVELAPVRGVG